MSVEFLVTSLIVVATTGWASSTPWRLSGVFMLLTLVIFVVYGIFAAAVRAHIISRPSVLKWMRRTFGAAFVALAGRLALAER